MNDAKNITASLKLFKGKNSGKLGDVCEVSVDWKVKDGPPAMKG